MLYNEGKFMKGSRRANLRPYEAIDMKTFVTLVAAITFSATTALAQTTVSGSVDYNPARFFPEQGLTACWTPTDIYSATVSNDGTYFNVWHAETGSRPCNETDLTLGHVWNVSDRATLDGNIAMFELAGPEAYRARLTYSYQVSDEISVSVNGDVVRGGFETDVLRVQGRWSDEIAGPFTGSAMVGLSVDSWSEDTVAQWNLGVSFPFLFGTTGTVYYTGYDVLDNGRADRPGEEGDDMFGVSVAVNPFTIFD